MGIRNFECVCAGTNSSPIFLFCKHDVLADENSSNNDINDKIEYIKTKL